MGTKSHALSRRWSAWLAVALAAVLPGCVSTEWAVMSGVKEPPVCQVQALWQNSVVFTPDPVHNGRMSPGIAGRVYLFGQELKETLTSDGGLVVELCDGTKPDGECLERWEIDPESMKRLGKRDGYFGWGYTVYLPWTKREPDVTKMTKVRLRVRYQPAKGAPLFTEDEVTLSPTNGQVSVQQGGPPMALPQMSFNHPPAGR